MASVQYRTVAIEYQRKRINNWVLVGEPGVVGMQAVLDRLGSEGWELVSMYPESMEANPGFGRWYIETTVYRAIFRRTLA
jgi:hypothetical protein